MNIFPGRKKVGSLCHTLVIIQSSTTLAGTHDAHKQLHRPFVDQNIMFFVGLMCVSHGPHNLLRSALMMHYIFNYLCMDPGLSCMDPGVRVDPKMSNTTLITLAWTKVFLWIYDQPHPPPPIPGPARFLQRLSRNHENQLWHWASIRCTLVFVVPRSREIWRAWKSYIYISDLGNILTLKMKLYYIF